MKRLLDKSNGKTEIFHYDESTGHAVVETRYADVEPILDITKALANDPDYTRQGMKEEWLHYAHLPDAIILKLKVEHGLSVFNPEHTKAVFNKVDELYPYFKTTRMKHVPKR